MNKKWHSITSRKVIEIFKSDLENGLLEKQVETRQKKFGLNKLPKEKPLSRLKIFLTQFQSPLIYLLVIAGFICLFLKEWADAVVIWAVVSLNIAVGFFQENKASNILNELTKVLESRAFVLREGNIKQILQKELIPGDIIILKPGEKVPADGRLVESSNLKINEAPLTGEWLPAEKHSKALAEKTPLADRENMIYMGTMIEAGAGKAIVTATGIRTEMGQVAQMAKKVKEEKTTLQKKIANFSRIVGVIIGTICFVIFIEGMITGGQFFEMFETSVAVAVAAIPEGLPVAMTAILAIGMQRILKKKGLVRKLSSVEVLGSTSVIATDKTLTLTEGKMEIDQVISKDKSLALKIGALCSEAFIENPKADFHSWKIRGRPTDRSLILGAANAGLLKPKLEKKFPKIDEIPFDVKYKFIATLHQGENKNILNISGAPEKIIELSSKIEGDQKQEKLNAKVKTELYQKLEALTSQGQRVIAVAYKILPKKKEKLPSPEKMNSLIFVGFIGLKDPLRKDVKKAVETCCKAGMRPIIVTGDHILTAKAIAKELGLETEKENIISGQDLDKLSDKALEKRLESIVVYARVEPKHKLRIIEAWQKKGGVIAMTGDGINDAPALKKADIGIALGSGTEVAKQASDLILLNDSFSIIVAAIEEGRAILDNIRKVITYLLSDSLSEVILVGVSIFVGAPLPITAVQILWVNLVEDGLPGIALTFEPKEKDLMQRKPESPGAPLLNKEMKALILIIGLIDDFLLLGLFFWLWQHNYDIFYIRTMIFAALTIDTISTSFSCKSLRKNIWQMDLFSNKFLIFAGIFGLVILAAAVYWPVFQTLLETVSLDFNDWLIILGLGTIEMISIEMAKYYFIVKKEV